MDKIYCSCGLEMGEMVDIEGVLFLRMGSFLGRSVHGVCIQCGSKFHWSVSDILMQRILDHYQVKEGEQNG